jgi:hypothetical protein
VKARSNRHLTTIIKMDGSSIETEWGFYSEIVILFLTVNIILILGGVQVVCLVKLFTEFCYRQSG